MSAKDKKKGALVPRLRFPEFGDAGEWEEVPLSNLVSSLDAGVSVNAGDRPATSEEVGILKTSAVTNGVFEPQENKVVLDVVEIGRMRESVRKDTIIISRMNTPALVGANAYVDTNFENIFLPDRLWAAKPKSDTSMRFISFILGSNQGRATLALSAKGSSGSMKNITKSDVLAFLAMIPSLPEQQRIADCLSSLDERITAETSKLDTLKDHKKGLLKQLFPAEGETLPRLRFPEFRGSGEWKKKSISDIGEVITGNTPNTADPTNYNGSKLFVSPVDISGNRFIYKTKTMVTEKGFQKGRIIPAQSVLFVCIGSTIGKTAQNFFECITNQQINSIVPDYSLSNSFLYFILSYYAEKIAKFAGNHAVPIINKSLFSSFILLFPNMPEQQRIADCLSSLDELITAQAQKIDLLKTHKKGLMQQLFPVIDEAKA